MYSVLIIRALLLSAIGKEIWCEICNAIHFSENSKISERSDSSLFDTVPGQFWLLGFGPVLLCSSASSAMASRVPKSLGSRLSGPRYFILLAGMTKDR